MNNYKVRLEYSTKANKVKKNIIKTFDNKEDALKHIQTTDDIVYFNIEGNKEIYRNTVLNLDSMKRYSDNMNKSIDIINKELSSIIKNGGIVSGVVGTIDVKNKNGLGIEYKYLSESRLKFNIGDSQWIDMEVIECDYDEKTKSIALYIGGYRVVEYLLKGLAESKEEIKESMSHRIQLTIKVIESFFKNTLNNQKKLFEKKDPTLDHLINYIDNFTS